MKMEVFYAKPEGTDTSGDRSRRYSFPMDAKRGKMDGDCGERELPARPLVLEAAGVPPNDPINSHQAVEILRRLGFETRYAKDQGEMEIEEKEEPSEKESGSILEMVSAVTREVPEHEWERVPADLSRNVDHYLYGSKRTDQ